jgi:hypothetical protein
METPGAEIVTPVNPPIVAEVKAEPQTDETVEFYKSKAKAMEKEAKKQADKLQSYERAEEERKQSELSDLQKAEARAVKAEADLKAKETAILRRDVASKVGLPAILADRLKGETPEEIEADATALLETLPKQQKTTVNPTNPGNASVNETDEMKKIRLGLSRNKDPFADAFVARTGGGVFSEE